MGNNTWWLLGCIGVLGCGSVGSSTESVSLAPAGVNVSVTVPTGGKVEKGEISGNPEIMWKGFNFVASFTLDGMSSEQSKPLEKDASNTFEQRTPVVVEGHSYACTVRAKKEEDAKRIQPACDALAKASPPPATAAAAGPATIELEEKTAPKIGSSIKIPKGAKTLAEDEYTATYSLPLPGGLYELNISLNKAGAANLDEAKHTATLMGGSVQEAKQLPNGLLEVVLAPEMKNQTVSVSFAKFGAKCAGPTEYLPKLLEMCESLSAPGAGKAAAAGTAAAPAGKAAAGTAAAPAGKAAAAPAKTPAVAAKPAPAPAKKK